MQFDPKLRQTYNKGNITVLKLPIFLLGNAKYKNGIIKNVALR